MFDNFRRWLSGSFTCIKCDNQVQLMTFGFGDTVCPSCYAEESPLVRLDESYILNRIIKRMTHRAQH